MAARHEDAIPRSLSVSLIVLAKGGIPFIGVWRNFERWPASLQKLEKLEFKVDGKREFLLAWRELRNCLFPARSGYRRRRTSSTR